jgi:hypothetical protein
MRDVERCELAISDYPARRIGGLNRFVSDGGWRGRDAPDLTPAHRIIEQLYWETFSPTLAGSWLVERREPEPKTIPSKSFSAISLILLTYFGEPPL